MDPNVPGWRIEQRFADEVLIGNWYEERLKYNRENLKHNSCYRTDFRPRELQLPDVRTRRKFWLRNDGLSKEMLLGHHGNAYAQNNVTWYDEHYNKRENPRLPDIRQWDSSRLSWAPERVDYPLQGSPTNWGLREQKSKMWKEQNAMAGLGDFQSTYSTSYHSPSTDALSAARFAPYKERSSKFNVNNKVNKDLVLRGGKVALQMPENIGQLSTIAT